MFPHTILSAFGVAIVMFAVLSSVRPARARRDYGPIQPDGTTT